MAEGASFSAGEPHPTAAPAAASTAGSGSAVGSADGPIDGPTAGPVSAPAPTAGATAGHHELTDLDRIERLAAREDIEDTLARYSFAVARHDWDEVLACFTPGAFADYGFEAPKTIEEQASLLDRGIRRFPASTLLSSAPVITWTSSGASSVTLALTAHEAAPETEEPIRVSVVRYEDEWRRMDDGRYRIARRRLVNCWKGWLEPRHDDRAGDHRFASEW